MEPTIFLSYAHEDLSTVQSVYSRLRDAGLRPWMDKPPTGFELEGISPGADWRTAIRTAMETARIVLAFVSPRSVEKKGFVQREYRLALDLVADRPVGEVFLIPVIIEPCKMPALSVGTMHLRDLQYFDMFELGVDALVKWLLKMLPRQTTLHDFTYMARQFTKSLTGAKNRYKQLETATSFAKREPERYARELAETQAEISALEKWLQQIAPSHDRLAELTRGVDRMTKEFDALYEQEREKVESDLRREQARLYGKYNRQLAEYKKRAAEQLQELEHEIIERVSNPPPPPDSLCYNWFREVPAELKTKTQWKQGGRRLVNGAKPAAYVYGRMARGMIPLYGLAQTEEES